MLDVYLEIFTENNKSDYEIFIFDGNRIEANFENYLNKNYLYNNVSILKIGSTKIIRDPIIKKTLTFFHRFEKDNASSLAEITITYHNQIIHSAEIKFEKNYTDFITKFLLDL